MLIKYIVDINLDLYLCLTKKNRNMLKGILAISGYPGLYEMKSQIKNGLIVEHIETKKRMPVYSTHKISSLEDIAIYTEDQEVILVDVFKNIFNKFEGKEVISHKSSNDELKSFFKEVLPDYDQDRVYVSDIKKVVNWYNILNKNNIITKEAIKEKEKEEAKEEAKENKEEKDDK